ncbi:159b133d-05d1-45f9-afaf-3b8854c08c3e [Thermothielavioides terrestris]|uniref:159b133d-05d1-45f9-afaf-3b8854c08c3e n=1 Tax=Thermothielavioides terrestris TaxID=2587410 RepID=A0A446B6T7_9PEZI|nr:159b133d-05d1-45f9-afaf-3b8854c08c3e [Thermothielavioides terrestris]
MATSLALRHAPEHVFAAAARTAPSRVPFANPKTTALLRSLPRLPPSSSSQPLSVNPTLPTTTTSTTTATATATTTATNPASEDPNGDTPLSCSWQTTALTLHALHGLAQSLAPAAGPELAPVQAWFELVGRFGAAALLRRADTDAHDDGDDDDDDAPVLDRLKQGLAPLVRCPHFGASIERAAFEAVVERW